MKSRYRTRLIPVLAVGLTLASIAALSGVKTLFVADEPIPSDAVVLFDGKDLSNWVYVSSDKPGGWKLEGGYMQVRGGNIRTKQEFSDCQLHVEFWLPLMPDAKGQARANSGVYLQGKYEVQVLDSYGLDSRDNDCGAIYGVAAPMVNACRPPKRWQSYDIVFRAARFNDRNEISSKPRMTVFHNGVLIHDNVEIPGTTTAAMSEGDEVLGPVMLQDHGNTVRYRNIWIRPLPRR